MSIRRYAVTLGANGRYEFQGGNFALLSTVSAAVNLRLEGTKRETFDGIAGGLFIKRINSWDNLIILGAAGVTFEMLVGNENVIEDETDVRLQVTTISGTANVNQVSNTSFTDLPAVTIPNASAAAVFAANLTRRGITIFSDSANAGSVFIRTTGGANNIGEIQPGQFYGWRNTAGLDIRNDSGAPATFYICEES